MTPEQREARRRQMLDARVTDPLAILANRYFPAWAVDPPLLADGALDVRELCRRWDTVANIGAGDPR